MERFPNTVYPAEWPGFPGETEARQQARADFRVVDESFEGPVLPADAMAINEALRAEESVVLKEAAESPIYDYEVEMQKPVPPLERVGWRQRIMRAMGKANETVREVSLSALVAAQAKAEEFYGDEEAGTKRKKATGAVAGALALGGIAYMEYKGVNGTNATTQEAHRVHRNIGETVLSGPAFPALKPHHQEYARQFNEVNQAQPVRQATEIVVKPGDNTWDIAKEQARANGVPNPSNTRIYRDDVRLLKLNHKSLANAVIYAGEKLKLLKRW